MWSILGFKICFFIDNDMSRVHGSVDLVVGGCLLGLPLTDGNWGGGGARRSLGHAGYSLRELDAAG
jgi:hypothetical protein